MNFIEFRNKFIQIGVFSISNIRISIPDFNTDNLLNWQKKGYIVRLRNGFYCFSDFLLTPDAHFLIANSIYSPSYISHQQALMFYGLIPEHIVDITSVSTKKTTSFNIAGRSFKYYNIRESFFFGYKMMEIDVNGKKRNLLFANKEKALLDFLYFSSMYKTEEDLLELRLNEIVLAKELDWKKVNMYLEKMNVKILTKRINLLKSAYNL